MSSVDVVVPCYRYGHFLRECVESVLSQSGPSVRVLIIDDASPDNTAEVAADLARDDSRVTALRHANNKGHIATYNEGIDWVSGDYMLLLSADDYLLPGALHRAVRLMENNPGVGFTFGNAIVRNERSATRLTNSLACKNCERIVAGLEFISLSGARNIVSTPTAVVRTRLQKRLGGYRTELPHSGDMEMWLRLAAHGLVGFVGAPQAVYRRHDSNMSRAYSGESLLRDLQQRELALECFFQSCGYLLAGPQQLRRRLLRSLGYEALAFASSAFNDGQQEISRRLSEYAVDVSPGIKRSLYWTKLACKRTVGYRTWRALRWS